MSDVVVQVSTEFWSDGCCDWPLPCGDFPMRLVSSLVNSCCGSVFESGTLVLCSVPSSCEGQLKYNWFFWRLNESFLPLVFQYMASLQLKFVHLNCTAAVPVCCVCNTWLWGQLSSQMRVRTLGRWLEMSVRVVEDVFQMIENAVPRFAIHF